MQWFSEKYLTPVLIGVRINFSYNRRRHVMKYIRQFGIIILISLIGELLKWLLPFPVPASIYGLVLMLLALSFHIIPLDAVKDSGRFLIDIMPLMFIPAAVGLLNSWGVLKPVFLPVLLITIITTIAVMAVTGRVTQFVIKKERKRKEAFHERSS